jgi:hypothetical protein
VRGSIDETFMMSLLRMLFGGYAKKYAPDAGLFRG